MENQSFLDHLEALRWHLIRSFSVILLSTIIVFCFPEILFDKIIFAIQSPNFTSYKAICRLSNFLGMKDAFCITKSPFVIMNINMSGQFYTHIVSSLIAGFILSFPYFSWEIWRFVKPALYKNEQRYTRGIVFFISLLFISGVLFGYFLVAPISVQFLGNYQVSSQVINQINLNSYISTVTSVSLANGLLFQLPILVYFLSQMGILTPEFLRKYRKHSLVVVLILSAIITPPDILSQILVSFPLLILYEISIKISSKFEQK